MFVNNALDDCQTDPGTLKIAGFVHSLENAKEFVLVPWKPSLEDMRGKVVSGTAGPNRNWEFVSARQRGIGI